MNVSLGLPVVLAALSLTPAAVAPANDNRDSAAPIPTFPATVEGSTVGATVERLDPQISTCGRIEGTVWYRIDQAPDGTVALGVQGAGFAPVIRVYDLVKNGIQEHVCGTAAAGATAQVAFGTKRGASYLVVVGHKPSTPDSAFELTARLFLPPLNDARGQASPFGKLSTKVSGSTLGATTDTQDPGGCRFADGTVWYSVDPEGAQRLVLRLHALGDLDAAVAVVRHVRNTFDTVACGATDAKGDSALAWDTSRGATYLIAVGQRRNSPPGDFTLTVLAAPPRDTAPGKPLPRSGATGVLDWLTNVNDVYSTDLGAGATYRVVFRSSACDTLVLRSKRNVVGRLSCDEYTTFTPGPDGGGRYILEVDAPGKPIPAPYTLRVVPAGADDVGEGAELGNLATVRGGLSPAQADVVDLYHFDVSGPSDVRLRLAHSADCNFDVTLLTDAGRRLGYADGQIRMRLRPGHYVVAVQSAVDGRAGRYALGLVVRQLTRTTLSASAPAVAPGTAVTFTATATPQPDRGVLELEIDRFDPLSGWQFSRRVRIRVPAGTVSWTPPAPGRWRARARFLGTLRFSPSQSGYMHLLVARPLG